MKRSLGQVYTDIYNAHKDDRYVGFYKVRQPDETVDPIASKNPFFQYGPQWKINRSQLSYCFTSGKMKNMFPLVLEVSQNLIKHIEAEGKLGGNPFDAKDLASKFTSDSVASCAFGLQGKAFEDPNSEFRRVAKKVLEPSTILSIKLLVMFLFPSCSKILNVRFIPKDAAEYYFDIIKTTLSYRKEHNIIRNDFLDVVTHMKFKSNEPRLTVADITAHAVSFFGDGFETSSITLSFLLYDLAANIDIQEKVRQEICEVIKNHGDTMSYEAIQDMNLLDRCISESMRVHPPVLSLSKICTGTGGYTLPPCNETGKEVHIEENTPIVIPIYAIHHDPKYYPNPEKFDPDRFSENNKSEISKGAYLPFGEGPRICIGMKFALLQIKIATVAIVQKFDVRVNKKTKEPLEINPNYFMLLAKGGLWLDFYQRSQ
ncbi:Cytochrome P450 [Popillia japonica]|uniref:Cytochrome P450 n=1 Tax=Popillia japonica TaxID=7064 RepID=A0AAW1HSA2_POPJA